MTPLPPGKPKPNPSVDWKQGSIDPRDYYVLSLVDGKRTTPEIALFSGLPLEQVAECLVRLANAGAIQFEGIEGGREPSECAAGVSGSRGGRAEPTRTLRIEFDPEIETPFQGELVSVPFSRVLTKLSRGKYTGHLTLHRGKTSKKIGLIDGCAVGVEAVRTNDYFGRYLLDKGAISLDVYNRSLERMYREKRRQGDVLVEMGHLSPEALMHEMALHGKGRVLDVFGWTEGGYEFHPSGSVESYFPPLDLISLAFEGARDHVPLERIRPCLDPLGPLYVLPVPASVGLLNSLFLAATETRIWEKISKGRSTVRELLAQPEMGSMDALRLIYALRSIDLVLFSEEPGRELAARSLGLQPQDEEGVPTPIPILASAETRDALSHQSSADKEPEVALSGPPLPGAICAAVEAPTAQAIGGSEEVLRGNLAEISIVALLRDVLLGRRTGILKLVRGRASKVLTVLSGKILGVDSRYVDEPFGRFLVNRGRISFLHYEETIVRLSKGKKRHGELLVEMGYLSASELPALLEVHSSEKAMELFSWEDGDFTFEEKPVDEGSLGWAIAPAKVFYGGIMRFLPSDRLRAEMESLLDEVPVPTRKAEEDLKGIGLSKPARSLWEEIVQEELTVRQWVSRSPLPEEESLRFVLALRVMGALNLARERSPERAAPIPDQRFEVVAARPPAWNSSGAPALRAVPAPQPGHPSESEPPATEESPGRSIHTAPPSVQPRVPPQRGKTETIEIIQAGRRRINPRKVFEEPTRFADHVPGGLWDGDFDEELARENVTKTYKYMLSVHHFKVLDIHESATQEEIDGACQQRLKEFDPDRRYKGASEDIRQTALKIMDLIRASREFLKDERRRIEYRREIFGEENLALEADVQYKKGDIYLFWRHEPAAAIPFYRSAIDLYAKNPEFHAALALSIYRSDRKRLNEALAIVQKGLALSKDADIPHLYLGMILASEGRKEAARKEFLEALRCNPRGSDAKKQLKKLTSEGGGASEGEGG